MPKVKITNSKGLVQEGGNGIEFEEAPVFKVKANTADFTVGVGGVYTLSGTGASPALTATMPSVASTAGATFIMRSLSQGAGHGFGGSGHARHTLTGSSADSSDVELFVLSGSRNAGFGMSSSLRPHAMGSTVDGAGQKLSWGDSAGDSIMIESDGSKFHVTPFTGTLAMQLNAWEA